MPGLCFLFWNLNRRPLHDRAARIAAGRAADLVVLAECPTPPADVISALAAAGAGRFHEADGSCGRLRVLSRLGRRVVRFVFADDLDRWLIYRVMPRFAPELLLAVAHLPSKTNIQEPTQRLAARTLAADIDQNEDRRKHQRSVLVGDLNMNPFEEGVAGAGHLHGVMARTVAASEERSVHGRPYRMFYNPMWGLLGDRTPGPPGTYYRSAAEAVNYYWNTYDQVLVRPELADRLTGPEVLVTDGVTSLLTVNGLPDRTTGSDHLPLVFRLDW